MTMVSLARLRSSSAPVLGTALLLAGFIALLIGDNYRAQNQVRQFAVADLHRNLNKRAAAISYFFSDGINDVNNVAASSEVVAYFENKALGMTMEYGLKAGLVIVSELFDKTMKERRLGKDPIYVRFALLDAAGRPLADVSVPGCPHGNDKIGDVPFGSPAPKIEVEAGAQSLARIYAPCFLKGRRVGRIIAWLRLQTLYDHLILESQSSSSRGDFLFYSAGSLQHPVELAHLKLNLLGSFLRFARNLAIRDSSSGSVFEFGKSDGIPEAFFHRSFGLSKQGQECEKGLLHFSWGKIGLLAAYAPVSNTPFSLVKIVSEKEALGLARPWQLLMAFAALAFLLLGGVAVILKNNVRTLILQARLEEASERERAVEKVNRELRVEIGEREKAETALVKSEKRYKALFDNFSDFVYAHDLDGRFLSLNPSGVAIIGCPAQEIIGRPMADFMPEELRQAFFQVYLPTLRSEGVFNGTTIMVSRDGAGTLLEFRSSLVEEQGQGVYITGSARDISERHRYEKELKKSKAAAEAANQVKSDFLANMSHELRTPLNIIIGFTELILDRQCGDLTPSQEEYLGDVLQCSRGLSLLIDDILDLTRIETGKLELELSEVQLPELLARSLAILREKASRHNIGLFYEDKDVPAVVLADERKLKQILYNLLANALKFTPDGGEVKLKSEARDGHIHLCVEDNGIGIRQDDLKRIFDPFEQVDNSLNRRFQGIGVGLSLTRSMVEIQGGKIWAESEGEGKGARFCFIIPYGET